MAFIGYILVQALEIYSFIIIATIIASWLVVFGVLSPAHPITQKIMRVLSRLTEPVLRPIQRIVPSIGGIDLSPIIVILV
jgi:YggT family protein